MVTSADMDTMEIEIPHLIDPLRIPQSLSSQVKIEFGACTHAGKVRENNEDAYLITKMARSWEKLDSSLSDSQLPDRHDDVAYAMAVADGMGGMAGGEVASTMAIRVLVSLILNATKWALKLDNPETRQDEIRQAMKRAEDYFKKVDQALLLHAEKLPRLRGMGTTLTGAYSFARDLFLVHVGDSRAYRYRNGKLQLMTRDQTLAQALTDAGQTLSEASSRRFRHTLTSCLGGQNGQIELEIHHHQLLDQDRLLICSDGLTEMLEDSEIAELLAKFERSTDACNALLNRALDKGGADNVTLIVSRYSIPSAS